MNNLKWWMRVVGAWYVFLGVGITFGYFANPEANAGFFGPNFYTSGFPLVLFWLVLGILLLLGSRNPGAAAGTARVVALVEIFVWVPSDTIFLLNGFPVIVGAIFIPLHLIIGFSGLYYLHKTNHGH